MEISEKISQKILREIARLSKIIFEGSPSRETQALGLIINHLTAVLFGALSLDGFHEEISGFPKSVREYYYELLFEER